MSSVIQTPLVIDYSRVGNALNYVYENAIENDPKSVLDTIDKFCYEKTWCMNVGDVKGQLIQNIIKKHNPKILVEIGGYYGYSAITFASIIKDNPDAHYYSIEYDPILACVIEKMVKFSGLSHKVTVLTGNLEKSIPVLREKYNVDTVDFMFIDHKKEYYLSDFSLAENNQLFHTGSVIVADNIVTPGVPDYLAYLTTYSKFQSKLISTENEYSRGQVEDALLVSICN